MAKDKPNGKRRSLVGDTAERMRDMVFAVEPGVQIGALPELAKAFGVGIITVQQAARVLEHEGLLNVRRGPSGGYYSARPDEGALQRMIAAYLRTHPTSYEEALDITSLLFNELVAAAAERGDQSGYAALRSFVLAMERCETLDEIGALESMFQDVLFGMVDCPLLELLTRVMLHFSVAHDHRATLAEAVTSEQWKDGRRRIVDAILRRDTELARFEAIRSNRRIILACISAWRSTA